MNDSHKVHWDLGSLPIYQVHQFAPGRWGTSWAKKDPIVEGDCDTASVFRSCPDSGEGVSLLGGESCKYSRAIRVGYLTSAVEEVLARGPIPYNEARNAASGLTAIKDVF